jgi:hypothetical protein
VPKRRYDNNGDQRHPGTKNLEEALNSNKPQREKKDHKPVNRNKSLALNSVPDFVLETIAQYEECT